MNTKDIKEGLRAPLKAGSLGQPIHWPNVGGDPGVRPRIDVQISVISRTGGTLKGNEVDREDGNLAITAVVEEGTGESGGSDTADAIAALYAEGSQFAITGGVIQILARPDIRGGFRARDKEYRIPVVIRYRATST